MKGTLVATWIETAQNQYGEKVNETAMKEAGWEPNRIFHSSDEIDDQEIHRFVQTLADQTGAPKETVWYQIGQNNAQTFFDTYPYFFQHQH